MKKGRTLELLVESLEKNLNDSGNVVIDSPKRIKSKINSNSREFDVVLSLSQSHHELIIAIECKDRKTPVGDPEIEGFFQKCEAVNVNKGMFVSTSGYTKSAIKSAIHYGIKCVSIDDIDTVDWLANDAMVVVHTKRFLVAKYKVMLTKYPNEGFNNFIICDAHNNEITNESIKNNLAISMDSFPCPELNKEFTHQIQMRTDNAYIVCSESAKKWSITGLIVDVTYVCEVSESAFKIQSYTDNMNNLALAEVASADISMDGKQKKVTLISTDTSTSINLIDDE